MRFGILGVANIARKYTASAMQAADSSRLTGIAARDFARAAEFAAEFDCRAYESYDELIESPEIDAVYIPLPIALHGHWATKALEAGKHVLCEKSLTHSYAEARPLVDLARASGLVLMENFMCENHPQNEHVQRMIANGDLGEVRHLSLSFGFPPFAAEDLKYSAPMGGGALNDAGAYCVDMASYYLQQRPESVWARLTKLDHEVDVLGSASLEFPGGVTAHLSFGFEHDYRNEARVWGSTGQVTIDRSFSIPPERLPDVTVTRNTVATPLSLPAANHFVRTIDHFVALAAGADKTAVLDKIQTQAAVMEAVRVSAREQRTVSMDEIDDWQGLAPWRR